MQVYRICGEKEVMRILQNQSFENIGWYGCETQANTHNYNNSSKYLHFFKDQINILQLDPVFGRFICVYDIPEKVLSKFSGFGIYKDIYKHSTLEIQEYAIPSELLKFEYLESIEEIIAKKIKFTDFCKYKNLNGLLKPLYSKNLFTTKEQTQKQNYQAIEK